MKILLVQLAFLGDVILSTPLIKGIKQIFPESELWFLTTPAAKNLLENDPNLNGVIAFDKRGEESGLLGLIKFANQLKKHQFDQVINLHKSYRTALLLKFAGIPNRLAFDSAQLSFLYNQKTKKENHDHEVDRLFSILNFFSQDKDLKPSLYLEVKKPDSLDQNNLMGLDLNDNYVILSPGSVWTTKRWPARYYKQLAQSLLDLNYKVVMTGSKNEQKIIEEAMPESGAINLAGKTSLQELVYILSRAKALVCNDSMILHAASSLKIPTVAIFCSTTPKFGFGPYNNRAIVVEESDLDCKPCSRHGRMSCPTKTNACMEQVIPAQVLNAFNNLLSSYE